MLITLIPSFLNLIGSQLNDNDGESVEKIDKSDHRCISNLQVDSHVLAEKWFAKPTVTKPQFSRQWWKQNLTWIQNYVILFHFQLSAIKPHHSSPFHSTKSLRMSHCRLILPPSSVILCVCGLVSSHCDINLVWSIVLRESLTQFVLQVSLPKGLYFKKRTNNTFSSNRHLYWSFPFEEEIYSVLKALQTYHKERLWCLAFFWIVKHGKKPSLWKDTIRDGIYSLTFFVVGDWKKKKLFLFHYMSQQKVSHFKYTLAVLSRYACSDGEQKDESLMYFVFTNPFLLGLFLARW